MSYGVIHQFKGGTKEQYEATVAAVHPSDGTLPAGQVYHAAGPSADGWTVVAVHDSKASWESFRDSILMPRMQQGVAGGFAAPPRSRVSRSTPRSKPDRAAAAVDDAMGADDAEPRRSSRDGAFVAHTFAAHVRTSPEFVWKALTDPDMTAAFLYGLAAHSMWMAGAPIGFCRGGRVELTGRVLHARCHERLSYVLQSGPDDPAGLSDLVDQD